MLSHLWWQFFANGPVGSLPGAIQIAAQKPAAQNQLIFLPKINNPFDGFTNAMNAQVAGWSMFGERNIDWMN